MQNQDVIKFYENKTRVQLRNVADKFLIFFVYTESNEQRLVLSYNFNQSYVYKDWNNNCTNNNPCVLHFVNSTQNLTQILNGGLYFNG